MIAFEVWLNGKKLCLASVGDAGVLTQILSWSQREPKADSNEKPKPEKTGLHVGGLARGEYMDWLERTFSVTVGDEVTVKIVEVEQADEPKHRKRAETGEERAQKVRDGLDAAKALLPSPPIEGDFLASLRGYDELLAADEPEMGVKVLANLGDLNACAPDFWKALENVGADLRMYEQLDGYRKKADATNGN